MLAKEENKTEDKNELAKSTAEKPNQTTSGANEENPQIQMPVLSFHNLILAHFLPSSLLSFLPVCVVLRKGLTYLRLIPNTLHS